MELHSSRSRSRSSQVKTVGRVPTKGRIRKPGLDSCSALQHEICPCKVFSSLGSWSTSSQDDIFPLKRRINPQFKLKILKCRCGARTPTQKGTKRYDLTAQHMCYKRTTIATGWLSCSSLQFLFHRSHFLIPDLPLLSNA